MGKSLNSLVRMQSWRVDERRRELSSARAALDRVLQLRRELEEELTREQKVAGESPNLAGFHYDNYAEAVILRRERLAEAVAETRKVVDMARDNLMRSFTDLKKYEEAETLILERELKEVEKKEQAVLDEIGTRTKAGKAGEQSEQLG